MGRIDSFASIPMDYGTAVYAAEFDNGIVKVGFSRTPRNRFATLWQGAKETFGAGIKRFHVGPPLQEEQKASAVEKRLLARMTEICDPLPNTREFFPGVPYETAVELVEFVSSEIDPPNTNADTYYVRAFVGAKDGLFSMGVEAVDFYAD